MTTQKPDSARSFGSELPEARGGRKASVFLTAENLRKLARVNRTLGLPKSAVSRAIQTIVQASVGTVARGQRPAEPPGPMAKRSIYLQPWVLVALHRIADRLSPALQVNYSELIRFLIDQYQE